MLPKPVGRSVCTLQADVMECTVDVSLAPALQGVANRDLKLENLLLDREGNTGIRPLLKICDFGFSKHEMNSSAKTSVGTPIYMAPEIIYGSNRYDAKVCIASHAPSWCAVPSSAVRGRSLGQQAKS